MSRRSPHHLHGIELTAAYSLRRNSRAVSACLASLMLLVTCGLAQACRRPAYTRSERVAAAPVAAVGAVEVVDTGGLVRTGAPAARSPNDHAVAEDLLRRMADGDRSAFEEMVRLGPGEGRLGFLVLKMGSGEAPTSAWIAEVFSRWGPSASAACSVLARGLAGGVNEHVYSHALTRIGREAASELTRLVGDTGNSTSARVHAARALGKIEQAGDTFAVRTLVDGLTDRSEDLRAACASALSGLWTASPRPAARALIEATHDPAWLVRMGSVGALGQIARTLDHGDPLLQLTIETFGGMLREERNVVVRTGLIQAIDGLGSRATGLAPGLLALLRDAEGEDAPGAALALLSIGATTEEVYDLLLALVDSGRLQGLAAAEALVACGSKGWRRATGLLLQIAQAEREPTSERCEAVRLLGVAAVGLPEQAIPALKRLSRDEDAAVANAAKASFVSVRALLAR